MRPHLALVALVASALLPAPARADVVVLGSVPIEVGLADGPAFSFGVRPELMLAGATPVDDDRVGTHGVGVYGELTRGDGATTVGAGLTYVPYALGTHLIAPSVGIYHRGGDAPDDGYNVSLFLGRRAVMDTWTDLPMGLRLDTRISRAEGHAVETVVSATFDVTLIYLFFDAGRKYAAATNK